MLFFRFWPRNLVLWGKTFGKREFVIKVGKHCDESLFALSRFLRLSFKNIFSWPQNQDSTHLTFSSQISTWGCSTQRFHASNVAIVGKMDSNTAKIHFMVLTILKFQKLFWNIRFLIFPKKVTEISAMCSIPKPHQPPQEPYFDISILLYQNETILRKC